MKKVWIVDDDRSIRWVLEKALQREGLAYQSFENTQSALTALDHDSPSVLLSDVRMPGESGLSLLKKIKEKHPQLPVIIMTAYSDLDTAVKSFQGGAFEYLPKPFDIDQALSLIRRAAVDIETTPAAESTHSTNNFKQSEMLGQAAAMQEVFRAIGRLSQSNVTVLITGESGTGKELVAHALHEHSPRKGKPFIAINTAAIPKDLLESELFGHERGSFTGAASTRPGRFQQAEGGTLFLDEIGDMPADLQVRLLRVLQDGEYYRVGGAAPMKANVRIIAATHQNLDERVKQDLFREDLLHRLNVVRLRLPALRERSEDIPLLMNHFLKKSVNTLGGEIKTLTPLAMQMVQNFSFPGNVRQLENICHWITVMAAGQNVDIFDLPPEIQVENTHPSAANLGSNLSEAFTPNGNATRPPSSLTTAQIGSPPNSAASTLLHSASAINGPTDWHQGLSAALSNAINGKESAPGDRLTREFETILIRTALTLTKGRRAEASVHLGWGRNTLTRKIQELGLDDEV